MRNLLLVCGEILVCYSSMYLLTKKFKHEGINIYAMIATFAACITSLKTISIIEINVPIGFGLTTSLIIGGNLLTENNKKEELRNYIGIIFLTAIISATILNLSGIVTSSDFNNAANEAYNSIFHYNLRIYIALIISIIAAILVSNKLYNLLRKNSNSLTISNIFVIIIVTFIENVIFALIGYLFELDAITIILLIIFRYIIKAIIGIIGTIPLYIINKSIK